MWSKVYADGVLLERGKDYEERVVCRFINHTLSKFGFIETGNMVWWIRVDKKHKKKDVVVVKPWERDKYEKERRK